jgi:hypothetical protein
MTKHKTTTREEWLAAQLELLKEENELFGTLVRNASDRSSYR